MFGRRKTEERILLERFLVCRVSPERLFLQYILDLSDQTRADKLAIVCGLDINNLYQIAANLKLERGDVQQAARFFQQSKVCK